jgi:IclR family acetate operon transcriptional repressor
MSVRLGPCDWSDGVALPVLQAIPAVPPNRENGDLSDDAGHPDEEVGAKSSESRQRVHLGLVDGSRLMRVLRARVAHGGLRYEPDVDHGKEIPLGLSASGLAWLSRLSDKEALHLVARQDPGIRHPVGPGAPKNLSEIIAWVHEARARRWDQEHNGFEEGISAMAAPLVTANGSRAARVIGIAGPSLQLSTNASRSSRLRS